MASETIVGRRELIVISKGVASTPSGLQSLGGADLEPLQETLAAEGVSLEPLFPGAQAQAGLLKAPAAGEPGGGLEELANFYHVPAADERLDALADQLRGQVLVEAAYVAPAGEPPTTPAGGDESINAMAPDAQMAPAATPNFVPNQIYLNASPPGIDARYAWTLPGGRGEGVKIIDCEWGWRFTHEDLTQRQMGVVVGSSASSTNHGTAVIGEIGGDRNSFGVEGICPEATVGAASFASFPYADTIRRAADRLGKGDILLLEIHMPGPRHNFARRSDQQGYIAVEWWPHLFAGPSGFIVGTNLVHRSRNRLPS